MSLGRGGDVRRVSVAAGLASAVLVACGGPEARRLDLHAAVEARRSPAGVRPSADGWRFAAPPTTDVVLVDGESRPVVLTTEDGFEWRGRVPAAARLHVGAQALPSLWADLQDLEVLVVAEGEGGRSTEVLAVGRARAQGGQRWIDFDADLGAWSGRQVVLRFSARLRRLAGAPAARSDVELGGRGAVAWGPVILESAVATPAPGEPPNVLLILVDTLRADHVGAYGYGRPTTPEIDRLLAAEGVVFEHAYAQAPWTLPSVASLFTGIQPGRFLDPSLGSFALPVGPDAAPVLAEILAAHGYTTAGFIANPTLHAGIGFGRGFETFYNPPITLESMKRHADDLTPRAEAWLRAHQRRPFFLYAHYLDPHDPYLSPELQGGRSPFLPDYDGPVTGDWIHGIYAGRKPLPDPVRDVPQVVALYDSEIHFVDRHVGRLIDALEPEVLARTLVVFTSDHGEELYDHGGWKHGQTLYEEQIRVPLILRWDGRLPRARREAAPVALLDVLPTLAAAAGSQRQAAWEGLDLVAALAAGQPVPRRTIFAQHLAPGGPLRAMVVRDGRKLVLFNRAEPFTPSDALQAHLWRQDLARLARAELYDLAADPLERDNLWLESQPRGDLESLIHEELDGHTSGLRIVAAGLPVSQAADVTIRFDQRPGRVMPYFLAPGDRLETSGSSIRLRLTGDGTVKGVVLAEPFPAVSGVTVDGLPRIFVGDGASVAPGEAIARAALRAGHWPPSRGATGVYLWTPARPTADRRRPEEDVETIERLRALGYVQ